MARRTDYNCPKCHIPLKKGKCPKCGMIRPPRQRHVFHPDVY